MKLEVTVSEVKEIFKEIQKQPEQLFEMIRMDLRETVGQYLTAMMNARTHPFSGERISMNGARRGWSESS